MEMSYPPGPEHGPAPEDLSEDETEEEQQPAEDSARFEEDQRVEPEEEEEEAGEEDSDEEEDGSDDGKYRVSRRGEDDDGDLGDTASSNRISEPLEDDIVEVAHNEVGNSAHPKRRAKSYVFDSDEDFSM